ncbi:hypothetical protein J2S17_000562 [Cytobacillus purgationiresistens]|uniref:Fur-regulated basic protein FbpA n=1 Tax=Cytobacillus purgationiresistens TaxID=863449 RepID=A0ABU0ABR0_9BACI|nr:hypothetical protein [Cytobacillus purgationiresistens]
MTENFAKKRLILFRDKLLQAKSDEEHRRYMELGTPRLPPNRMKPMRFLKGH